MATNTITMDSTYVCRNNRIDQPDQLSQPKTILIPSVFIYLLRINRFLCDYSKKKISNQGHRHVLFFAMPIYISNDTHICFR